MKKHVRMSSSTSLPCQAFQWLFHHVIVNDICCYDSLINDSLMTAQYVSRHSCINEKGSRGHFATSKIWLTW